MTAKHTPGPWTVFGGDGQHVEAGIFGMVATAFSAGGRTSTDNAALIAAAPELLAELIDAQAWLSEHARFVSDSVDEGFHATLDGIRAAITKATGGAS